MRKFRFKIRRRELGFGTFGTNPVKIDPGALTTLFNSNTNSGKSSLFHHNLNTGYSKIFSAEDRYNGKPFNEN